MFSKAWAWIAGVLAFIGAFFLALRTAKDAGKQEQRADDAEAGVDEVIEANRIRDRVRGDAEFANRVRDRFNP